MPLLLLLALAAPSFATPKPAYEHYMKGLLLQRQGLYDQALREYQAVVTIDPSSDYVLQQASELALDLGQPELALEFAEALVKAQPKDAKAHHLVGNIRWSQGDAEAAKKAFAKALQLEPERPETLYSMATLISATDPEGAKAYFLRYLAASPDSGADVHYQIALLEHRAGHDDAALERLRAAIALEPGFAQARYTLAQIFEARKDTAAAFAEYEALLPLDSDNVALLVRLGELSFASGDKEKAAGFFAKGAELEPSHPAARFWLAFLAEEAGDWSKAAEELSRSSALTEDPAISLRLSYYLTQAGRLEEAVGALVQARARWPEDPELAYFLGLGYDDLGRTEPAVAAMKDAARLKPDSREARFQLGAMLEKLGRIEEAEKAFRELLETRPDDAATLNYLGYSLADRGLKLPEAERLIEKAVALEPENGAYLDSLGWVRHRLGRDAEALGPLRQALAKIADDEILWEHYGDVQDALGDRGEAWLGWKLALRHGAAPEKLDKRLDRAQDRLSDEQLGALQLRFLQAVHDDISTLHGFCKVEGRVGSDSVEFDGLLKYSREDGRLKLDVLGPLFVPLWSLTHEGSVSDLGGFEVPGLEKEALENAAAKVLELLHAYFDGTALRSANAKLKKGWTRSWVETDGWTLFLSKDKAGRLASLRRKDDRRYLLEVGSFKETGGRLVPGRMQLKGPGFSVTVDLKQVKAEGPLAAPTPAP